MKILDDIVELQTERLLLRQWRDDDFKPFASLNGDPVAMQYFPQTMNRAQSDVMARRCQSLIEERGWGMWALQRKDTNDFIGFTGLHIPIAELPFAPCVEVGWRLLREHWGQGFATEAAQQALRFGFERLELDSIVSFTAVNNWRSRRVMERLGMQNTGRNFDHPDVPDGNHLKEHVLYKISKQV